MIGRPSPHVAPTSPSASGTICIDSGGARHKSPSAADSGGRKESDLAKVPEVGNQRPTGTASGNRPIAFASVARCLTAPMRRLMVFDLGIRLQHVAETPISLRDCRLNTSKAECHPEGAMRRDHRLASERDIANAGRFLQRSFPVDNRSKQSPRESEYQQRARAARVQVPRNSSDAIVM